MNELFMEVRTAFLEDIWHKWWGNPEYRKSLDYGELITQARDAGKTAADKYPISGVWINPSEYTRSRGYAYSQLQRLLGAPTPTGVNYLIARAARAFGAGWRLRQTEIAEAMSRIPAPSVIQDTL
ncbi:MAG: hypothetical protein HYW26_03330 [Candidatus Aenigmarchaeota archaeon]|nr:hypothetical protein [Candidatus Aenigmarchaeota archaeon]